MKKVFFALSAIILTVHLSAKVPFTDSDSKTKEGISFHQGTWEEAMQLAKKEGKPIFLDIYASWCGSCKKLKEKTFPDSELGEFYNTNFINVAMDGEKGEGIKLVEKYNVKGYPNLIFISPDGELIFQKAGYRNPKQLIDLGKQITD